MQDPGKLAIDGGTPAVPSPIPAGVSGPSVFGDEEVAAAADVLREQNLFRYRDDSQCNLFEAEVADFLGVRHALIVNSGTSALICALKAAGIGPGDEVIIPAYTYMATPCAVIAAGAVPVMAEIDDSLGLDPADVERRITPHTRAVMPVHMRGVPNRLDDLVAVARRHGLRVIEDCCQCVGGQYRGRRVGTYSDIAAWSLNFYKTISAGEGGVVFTNDTELFERAGYASDPGLPLWQGQDSREIDWDSESFPGAGFRPSELIAAVSRVQLGKIEDILSHQRALKKAFLAELDEPRSYRLQHVDDPEGDTGVSAGVIVSDPALARGYAHALKAEGVDVGAIFNDGIPDRHIYTAWESILEKRSHHPSGYPWKDPAYVGDVEYSKDMCPATLDLLGRTLLFDFHMNMDAGHARAMAAALNKVDRALGG